MANPDHPRASVRMLYSWLAGTCAHRHDRTHTNLVTWRRATPWPREGARTPVTIDLSVGVCFPSDDEAPEFSSTVLQSLRQPLESGDIVVARQRSAARFPARFQLVLAANPCPCGKADDKGLECSCASKARRDYLGKLSGPLLDRVDLQLRLAAVRRLTPVEASGEDTATVAARVAAARAVQRERLAPHGRRLNAHMPGPALRDRGLRLSRDVTADIDRALDRGLLTLRGYDRVLRIAWTTADLAGRTSPARDDIGLALGLRTQAGVAA